MTDKEKAILVTLSASLQIVCCEAVFYNSKESKGRKGRVSPEFIFYLFRPQLLGSYRLVWLG